MNIFYKISLQGLKKNRTRTLVTVVGVALSAALFTAVATFGTSLLAYMARCEIAKGGNWHVVFSGVDPSQKQEWKEDAEILSTAEYENLGYALIPGAEQENAEGGNEKPYLFIAGFSDETFEALPVRLISGRKPENSSEVLVPSDSIAAKAGVRISVNETLTLAVGERESEGRILTQCDPYTADETLTGTEERTYTVVGTFERPGFELHAFPGYTLITKADGGAQGKSCSLYIALKNPRMVRDYAGGKTEGISCGMNEDLLRFLGASDNKVINTLLFTVGGVLALIIMTGSVFLIYNSFHISMNERVHQYGILMSVGATAKQLRGAVLFEGVCIGCIGIPIGIAVGIGGLWALLPAVSRTLATMVSDYGEKLTVSVSLPALLGAVLISMVTILISAYIPAKKAAATPVMDCIRQTGEIKTEAKSVRIRRSAWKLYGLEGTLALKNFKRNKKRYRSIVMSLTLSIVLAVAGSAFGTILKKIGREYTGQQADGDVSFVTQDLGEEEFAGFYDKMRNLEGITRSTWQADYFYTGITEDLPEDFLESYRAAEGDDSEGGSQQVTLYTQFIEDDIYTAYVEELGLPVEEYTGEDGKVLICVMNAEDHTTYFAGDSMHFSLLSSAEGGTKEICATFEDNYPLDGVYELDGDDVYVFVVTAPLSMKPQFEDALAADGRVHLGAFFWTDVPRQIVGEIQTMLVEEGITADYRLYNLSQAFEIYRRTEVMVNLFTYTFTVMIALIAVANVFNTISTNIRLRRRELAMLRSVGMSDKGFNRMMRFECFFYGMWTLVFGVPIASGLSFLIHKAIVSVEELDHIAFTFPWGAMCVSVSCVFAIVFITMVYATGKIRKENIIDALRDEMA